ncbi:putative cell division protein FtsW [Marvinbryantia formatexigens DSM 14469]|uniref:Probable peptidoglycan glycosyltransferase FtsW n=1 Tax=Marvinbryantia formatexigens DSM 14469 TaxID=478749 RepID=C6LH07_9FIRM|nr:putative cell division protein FtsW [Marvinbryantia formatexigens DSM 14469]
MGAAARLGRPSAPGPSAGKFCDRSDCLHPGKKNPDYTLLIIVLALVVFGLVTLQSTSAYNGRVRFLDAGYYFKKQLFATVLGLIAMGMISRMDYHIFSRFAVWGYLASLALSGAVLLVGDSYNGSKRWLSLGPLSFQPSEFAKPAVILFLAYIISSRRKKQGSIAMLTGVVVLVLPIVALVGTNNLSTAIIILGIAVILAFVSNPKYLQFVWLGLTGVGFIAVFLSMEQYRLERLAIWRNPEAYEKGFQTIQGLYAIGSGGLFGRGLGESLQKLGFVPEAQNDMIFSIICEELGLMGALLLLFIFLLMLWRFMVIATHAPDLFGALICAGIMGHIAIQVILNVAVVTNTIPNTGITLPFISYGGTSVLFLLAEMGLALSVSRWQKGNSGIY